MLKSVTFHEKVGNYYAKTEANGKFAAVLADLAISSTVHAEAIR